MNLTEFDYREERVPLKDLFPSIDNDSLRREYGKKLSVNHHEEVLRVARDSWKGGYKNFLEKSGFHQAEYSKFSGHCHQITPILGAALLAKGFEVAYLEAYRAYPETGEKVDPIEEQSEMRGEFCGIGRIPYCCLEVEIDGQLFYLSGKHLKEENHQTLALLTPDCYRDFDAGVFRHQNDSSKSGIYLAQETNFPGVVNGKPFVWRKQKVNIETGQPLEPAEFFKTYCYMKLTFHINR